MRLDQIRFGWIKAGRIFAIALFVFLTFGVSSFARAQTADIQLEIVSGGFIIGGSGGSGTLIYKGKRYPLSVGGLGVGATIGLAKARLYGRAYNLRSVYDITGTYTAADVGYALGSGRKTARLTNSRGVVLQLRGRQVGLEATADLSGMRLSLR